MGDEGLTFPHWQRPLQELILEFDRERLLDRIRHVEHLIALRFDDLKHEHEAHPERQALQNGLAIVQLVRRNRLDLAE